MKILNQHIAAMYLWAIALLVAVAAISSYTMHTIPFPLLVAVAIAAASELFLTTFYLKRPLKIPISGVITGLIVGSVAQINAPLAAAAVAAAVAIASKIFIRSKGVNVFNPAAFGIVVAMLIFSISDEWWAAGTYNIAGLTLSIAPVLLILAYLAKRLTASASFIITSMVISVILAPAAYSISISGIDALVFGINYYLAFVMIAEPKTSPSKRLHQVAFGVAIAALITALALLRLPSSPILLALLIGNAAYSVSRRLSIRMHRPSAQQVSSTAA